jgi:nucleoside-diphosphate-sugar epimerase
MRRVLITGGAGFIGAAVVHRLLARGWSVRVLDNFSRGASRRLDDINSSIECLHADIRDREAVLSACAGRDLVIHLAAVNGTRHFYEEPVTVLDVAVRGMLNILDGCRAHHVPELVLASSSEVYHATAIPTDETVPLLVPDPCNPRYAYSGGKIISELMTINWGREYFRRVVIIRPHNVYGPDMGFDHVIPELALRIRELPSDRVAGEFRIQGTGNETRAFVHIDDFVNGLLTCIDHGVHLGIYHVGTMEEITIADLTHRIAACLGRQIRIAAGELRAGSPERRCPDIGRVRALGYEPRIRLEAGLPGVVDWYDRHADLAPPRAP